MKCVVLAYHNVGRAGIEALERNGFEISAIFTHKDNPSENIWFGSVAELAGERGIPVFAPEDINHPVWVGRIRAMAPDFRFRFYYRNLIKEELLSIPKHGCINLHGSLLPKYRGRVPINWAIINGETETGVTTFLLNHEIDKGGTLRLGAYPCKLMRTDTKSYEAYQDEVIYERHRHRYEFNNDYRDILTQNGLTLSGLSPDGRLVETVELSDRPFYVGVQYHPEFKSRPNKAHPLFKGFIAAALEKSEIGE